MSNAHCGPRQIAEQIVLDHLIALGLEASLAPYASIYDIDAQGLRIEVKHGRMRADGRWSMDNHQSLTDVHIDAYVIVLDDVPSLRRGELFFIILRGPITNRVIQFSPQDLDDGGRLFNSLENWQLIRQIHDEKFRHRKPKPFG